MSENKIKVTTGSSGKLKLKTAKSPKPKAPKAVKVASPEPSSPKLATVGGTTSKATLYVDVDDEITAIIEKVQDSRSNIIALVLPKRAAVMQSIVNMKLLKRAADQEGKNLVLVTSEASLLPLAGLVGLHVADTPTSKPVVPPLPDAQSDEPESIDEPIGITDNSGATAPEAATDFDADAAANTPVGELAGIPAAPVAAAAAVDEVILDDAADVSPDSNAKPDVVPVKKNKKLAVPSFDTFRLRVVLGVLLLALLITGWIFATKVMPRAQVAIATNSQVVRTDLNVTLDTGAKAVDATNKIIPAIAQTTQKNYSQQVAATGQQNNGTKAAGNAYFALTDCSYDTVTIPAGSGVSSGGNTYITQDAVVLSSAKIAGKCNPSSLSSVWSGVVKIVSIGAGTKYNIAKGVTLSVPSSINGASSVAASTSTEISGGTDNIVKVVAQADIDSAKAKIAAQDTTQLKKDLQMSLQGKGLLAVPTTFVAGEQQVKSSANPGDAADTVTVTSTVPYTMLGINQADLQTLVVANVKTEIDTKKQKILDDGVAKATFTQQQPATATNAVVAVKVQSIAGPELNVESLKQQVAGKKSGDIKKLLSDIPGVTEVQVKYSPFWVNSAPKDSSKITIDIAKPTGAK